MKLFTSQLSYFVRKSASRRNVRLLLRFIAVLLGMVAVYSVLFHMLMLLEGHRHSWVTGLYWTLTVMSTLGFGDITFASDLGRVFSIFVLLSGMVFLLILLPFTFIEFFYAPWMQAQAEARAPRQLAESVSGHVILTAYDPVLISLMRKLDDYGRPYVLVVGDLQEALRLHDLGVKVLFGEPDRPETYRLARAGRAAMVAATGNDFVNTNIAFTVREQSESVPIVTVAASADSVDILRLAGSSHVLQLAEMMGCSLARRIIGADVRSHVIGSFGGVRIAEATPAGMPLEGKTLAESRLRELVGVSVLGMWKRGRFEVASAATRIDAGSILLLAGSEEQLHRYDELFCIYHVSGAPVIIIGGGRAAARALEERDVDYRIVEMNPGLIRDPEKYVHGNAADLATLERAGLRECPAVVITPHDDDQCIYLTIYCRRLRPDIQIISRAVGERNVSTLHRAGADFVLSLCLDGCDLHFQPSARGRRADGRRGAARLRNCGAARAAGQDAVRGRRAAGDRVQRRGVAEWRGAANQPGGGSGDAAGRAHHPHLHAGGGTALHGTLRRAPVPGAARVNELIRDALRNPFTGIGKPEPPKGTLKSWRSRRIAREHRLVDRCEAFATQGFCLHGGFDVVEIEFYAPAKAGVEPPTDLRHPPRHPATQAHCQESFGTKLTAC
jgi:Trk K+ transport system NAD-binding subunit